MGPDEFLERFIPSDAPVRRGARVRTIESWETCLEIRSLEAGAALDGLISTIVFHFVWNESLCRICGWPLAVDGYGCKPNDCSMRPSPEKRADSTPAYSRDIVAAWRIVEAIGLKIQPTGLGPDGRRAGYYAGFDFGRMDLMDPDNPFAAFGENAPLAICRAALLFQQK